MLWRQSTSIWQEAKMGHTQTQYREEKAGAGHIPRIVPGSICAEIPLSKMCGCHRMNLCG